MIKTALQDSLNEILISKKQHYEIVWMVLYIKNTKGKGRKEIIIIKSLKMHNKTLYGGNFQAVTPNLHPYL